MVFQENLVGKAWGQVDFLRRKANEKIIPGGVETVLCLASW